MIYALWDTGTTMGCRCDAGYTGPDCSGKACKYGIDPLYVDDDATARVSEQHYSIGGGNNTRYPLDVVSGTYAIKFYDVFGEDYLTQPIKINTDSIISGEGCNDVVAALEGLPNTVIPKSSVICSASQIYKTYDETSAQTYSLTFTGNPGYLKPLTIDTYLDGDRETVTPTDAKGETTVTTFNRGVSGEFVDYFASKCEGVTVQLVVDSSFFADSKLWDSSTTSATYDTYYSYELYGGYYLDVGDGSSDQEALLKKCLGDSDGNDSYGNNVEVYDWDYGSYFMKHLYETPSSHPHAIKLVSVSPSDDYEGGKYYLTWYQSLTNRFILVNAPTYYNGLLDESYYVYATDGIVERVIVDVAGKGQITTVGTDNNQPPVTAYFEQYSNVMYTSYDVACETAISTVEPCLDKGDMLFVVDSTYLAYYQNVTRDSPSGSQAVYFAATDVGAGGGDHLDLYTITKIYKQDPTATTFQSSGHEDRYRIVLDKNIPFAGTTTSTSDIQGTAAQPGFGAKIGGVKVGIVNLFKFSPATTGNYEFTSECSNRGSCVDGVCECYKGYTMDDCGVQSAYAV